MAPNSKNIMKKGICVERIIITWKYIRIIITTTTKKKKKKPAHTWVIHMDYLKYLQSYLKG